MNITDVASSILISTNGAAKSSFLLFELFNMSHKNILISIWNWPLCLLEVTSAITLGVLGEAADYSLHRLLQHRRVPGVTVAGSPRPEPRSDTAVQAVELQRRQRRRRPRRSGQWGRGGQKRRDRNGYPGSERGAERPGRCWTESNPRLEPLRADTVRDNVGFHCPNVTSTKCRWNLNR